MEENIKVAMITRPNLYSVPGGDTIQIIKTAEFLRHLYNVEVEIILNNTIDYDKFSLVHFFNIICPEDILGHVYKISSPYVVSTIYVDYREYDNKHREDIVGKISRLVSRDRVEYLKTLTKYLFKKEKISTFRFFFKGHQPSINFILKNSAIILPNSQSEYNRLKKDYKPNENYKIIPNAIDPKTFRNEEETERNIILCVGRIEGRKNQLNVIRALKETDYKVIFIGDASPNQKKYYDQCRKEATVNMQFINFISQEELIKYYRRTKVHVLASWFETTGLSNLEAGVMGCNLVIGNRGDVKDYFEDYAFYCEPDDLDSIKNAIDKAWNSDIKHELKNKILHQYTWTQTAKLTYDAYKSVLKNSFIKKQSTK